MAPSQPPPALLHAVSHWLQSWSDFALAQTAQPDALAAPADQPATAVLATEPPTHWLALLHEHGLTWDAAQGIAAQGASTVEGITETQSVDQPIFREGLPGQADGLRPVAGARWARPSRKMASEPSVAPVNPAALPVVAPLPLATSPAPARFKDEQPTIAPATAVTSNPTPPIAPAFTAPLVDEQRSAHPIVPIAADTPFMAWLPRLHQGVTALLTATSPQGNLADLPTILTTYAPDPPKPEAVATPASPAHQPTSPPPVTPPAPAQPLIARPPQTEATPVPPQRVTRLQLRAPGTQARSKDFSHSPANQNEGSTAPQGLGKQSSGKVEPDQQLDRTNLPGRWASQPAQAPMPPQPAVQVTRLRVQSPGRATVAAPPPVNQTVPPTSIPMPIATAARAPTAVTPATPSQSLLHPAAEPRPTPPLAEEATHLARIEAMLTRLLAAQTAAPTSVAPTVPPTSINQPPAPQHDRWPTLPQPPAPAPRPTQRRQADPLRRQRLEAEQRGRAWNG